MPKKRCYGPQRIDACTWNTMMKSGAPILRVRNWYQEKHAVDIDLTKPEEDYDALSYTAWRSVNYFCTNLEYVRDKDLSIPGSMLLSSRIKSGWELMYRLNPETKEMEYINTPMFIIPTCFPWIFNVVHGKIRGYTVKLRWGPHYLDPVLKMFYEISLGPFVIWTNSRLMSGTTTDYEKGKLRAGYLGAFRSVLENQHLPIWFETTLPEKPHWRDLPPVGDPRMVTLRGGGGFDRDFLVSHTAMWLGG